MNLTWTDIAWGQYEEWQKQDKKIVKKIKIVLFSTIITLII